MELESKSLFAKCQKKKRLTKQVVLKQSGTTICMKLSNFHQQDQAESSVRFNFYAPSQ